MREGDTVEVIAPRCNFNGRQGKVVSTVNTGNPHGNIEVCFGPDCIELFSPILDKAPEDRIVFFHAKELRRIAKNGNG